MNNMVINTNEQATRIHSVYNKNIGQMNAAMTRIATAQKINSAKDGAANWAISEKMRERMRANDQANQNVQNDSALLKTAQDGIGNTLNILQTLKERAINSANDSNITQDRTYLVEEVKQLARQIDDNAAKVKFNGIQLLNGAAESGTISSTSGTATTSAVAVTATENYGDKAVYSITNLKASSGADAAGDTNLTALVGSNGQTLFQEGDKITFNWTDNGVSRQATVAVSSNLTVDGLLAATSGLGKTADGSTSFDSSNSKYLTKTTDTTAKVADGTKELLAPEDGLYLIGAEGHNISNLSISVTGASGATNTAAQEALQPNGIQQSYGTATQGSNAVVGGLTIGGTNSGDETRFLDINSGAVSDTYELTIGGKTFKFAGSTTISAANATLKGEGINAELHVLKDSNEVLTYGGQAVTKGTHGSTLNYTPGAGLYFVGGQGESLGFVEFKYGAADYKTDASSNALDRKLYVDDTTGSGGSTSSAMMLPQGRTLQFFVGGEANFGVNFSIGKATAGTLFGKSADAFASMFQTKEGANSAINIIDTAINKALTEQTRMGAMEARLGYTSDNLSSMNTNLEAAVSAYRDSDPAKEMVDYMKYAVTSQAAQYMLATAGQNAYNVLQLLQP